MAAGISVLLVAAFAMGACDRDEDARARATPVAPAQPVVVTRDSKTGPPSCHPKAVGELMVGFLHDVNAGRDPTGSFSSTFQWYSMTEGNPRKDGRHFAGFDVPKVARYFERRTEHEESMHLLEMQVIYDQDRDLGHVTYLIERTADDTAEFGTKATGKGAIACGEGKIELLSMGMAKGIAAGMGMCPEPPEPSGDAAIVCSSQ